MSLLLKDCRETELLSYGIFHYGRKDVRGMGRLGMLKRSAVTPPGPSEHFAPNVDHLSAVAIGVRPDKMEPADGVKQTGAWFDAIQRCLSPPPAASAAGLCFQFSDEKPVPPLCSDVSAQAQVCESR